MSKDLTTIKKSKNDPLSVQQRMEVPQQKNTGIQNAILQAENGTYSDMPMSAEEKSTLKKHISTLTQD